MTKGHKIKQKIDINKFLEQIREYEKSDVRSTEHSFFRFSEEQRKKYNKNLVRELLFHETPFLVGIQNNGLWAIFYRYEKEIFRIILDFDVQDNKIYIVTLYLINEFQIPRI